MFDYLLNYGVKKTEINYEDLDVNDRLQLQDQINSVRNNYYKLLQLLDEVQEKYLDVSANLTRRTKELMILKESESIRGNSIFMNDEEYTELEIKQSALKTGISMINSQIDYCKNDLRILNSVFYNKF